MDSRDRPTVLVVGSGERMKDALAVAMERHGLLVESSDVSDVFDAAFAAVPDLLLLVGDAGSDGGHRVLARLAEDPHTAAVPVAVLADDDDADRRVQTFQHGIVGVVRRTASADAMARSAAQLARELPKRAGEAGGEIDAASIDDLVALFSEQLRTGILSVAVGEDEADEGRSVQVVLRADRPAQESMNELVDRLRPLLDKGRGHLRYEFHETLPSRLALLDDAEIQGSEEDPDALRGRRVLLIERDPVRADLLSQELRAHGALVIVTDGAGTGIEARASHHDPEIVVLDASGVDGWALPALRALRRNARLRWASLLVVDAAELISEASQVVGFDRFLAAVRPLVQADRDLRQRALEQGAFDTRLEMIGPSRMLRALTQSGAGLRVTVRHPRVRVEIDLADGLVVSARAVQPLSERELAKGPAALAALLPLRSGKVHVQRQQMPSAADVMAPVEDALASAASERPPIRPSDPPPSVMEMATVRRAAPSDRPGARPDPEELLGRFESLLEKLQQVLPASAITPDARAGAAKPEPTPSEWPELGAPGAAAPSSPAKAKAAGAVAVPKPVFRPATEEHPQVSGDDPAAPPAAAIAVPKPVFRPATEEHPQVSAGEDGDLDEEAAEQGQVEQGPVEQGPVEQGPAEQGEASAPGAFADVGTDSHWPVTPRSPSPISPPRLPDGRTLGGRLAGLRGPSLSKPRSRTSSQALSAAVDSAFDAARLPSERPPPTPAEPTEAGAEPVAEEAGIDAAFETAFGGAQAATGASGPDAASEDGAEAGGADEAMKTSSAGGPSEAGAAPAVGRPTESSGSPPERGSFPSRADRREPVEAAAGAPGGLDAAQGQDEPWPSPSDVDPLAAEATQVSDRSQQMASGLRDADPPTSQVTAGAVREARSEAPYEAAEEARSEAAHEAAPARSEAAHEAAPARSEPAHETAYEAEASPSVAAEAAEAEGRGALEDAREPIEAGEFPPPAASKDTAVDNSTVTPGPGAQSSRPPKAAAVASRRATMLMGTVARDRGRDRGRVPSDPPPAPEAPASAVAGQGQASAAANARRPTMAMGGAKLAHEVRPFERETLDDLDEIDAVAVPGKLTPPPSLATPFVPRREPSGEHASAAGHGGVPSRGISPPVEHAASPEAASGAGRRGRSRRPGAGLLIAAAAMAAVGLLAGGIGLVISMGGDGDTEETVAAASPAPATLTAGSSEGASDGEPAPVVADGEPGPADEQGATEEQEEGLEVESLPPPRGDVARAVARRDHDFLIRQGNVHRRRGELEEAEVFYLRTLALDRDHPRALAGLARVALRREQGQRAVRWARALAQARPRIATNHLLLGDAHELAGDQEAATAAWEHALELAPRHTGARRRLAQARTQQP